MANDNLLGKEKIGQRLYKYIGDRLVQCRLMRVKNSNSYVVKTGKTNVTINYEQYKSYTKLREDGCIIISEVELSDGIPDIIVSFFRYKDMTKGVPYAVCRQNIYDVFTNTIENDGGAMYIGCSVSKTTCPENIKFAMMMACNKVISSHMIAVYYDDDLDNIMECLNGTGGMSRYNQVMEILNSGYIKDKVRGQCSSVKQLLAENHFIEDVYRGFKILKTNFSITGNEKFYPEFFKYIEDIIKVELIAPVITSFTRDIDLSKIKDKYILLLDADKKLFVVSYAEGNYVNRPYEALHDTTEVDMLLKNRRSK